MSSLFIVFFWSVLVRNVGRGQVKNKNSLFLYFFLFLKCISSLLKVYFWCVFVRNVERGPAGDKHNFLCLYFLHF